jgi:hypothetical protein
MTRAQNASKQAAGEDAVRAAIAGFPEPYRAMGERLHELIMQSAPGLTPRTWYGMPAYAKGGKVVCFFRVDKYMTFGLTEDANLAREEGAPHQLMPSAWFLDGLDAADLGAATEARIADIVRQAAS